jgi:phenylacetic acid degradation operon negative regulatory protein
MTKDYQPNLTEEILLFLVDVIKAPIKAFFDTPYKRRIYKKTFYPRISSLEKSGYIKRNKKVVYLTTKGKIRAWYTKWKFKKIDIKKWDGKWRVLSFDVPENKKRLRENLRRKLTALNFTRLHDSVWITSLPIEKEIIKLLQMLEIKYFVRYMIVEKMNFDKDLRKKFFK